jgi:hypothetical protein
VASNFKFGSEEYNKENKNGNYKKYAYLKPTTSVVTKMHNSEITGLVQKCEASNQVSNVHCSSKAGCNLSVRYLILTMDQTIY